MSDGPSHFKNDTVRRLSKGLNCRHHFTLPYTLWSNDRTKRLGKQLLRTAREIILDLQLRLESWPDLTPIVQGTTNTPPSKQRSSIAPIPEFTGLAPSTPISIILRFDTAKVVSLTNAQREKIISTSSRVDKMEKPQPIVQFILESYREQARGRKSKEHLTNFTEGDYVLVAREDFFASEKLCLKWGGPRHIVCSDKDSVYQVEDLSNGAIEAIHASRIKFYHEPSLNQKLIMDHVLSSEIGMPVSRLFRLIESEGKIKVLMRWNGLSNNDETMEPLAQVYEYVPDLLKKLSARRNTPKALARKVRAQFRI